MEHKLVLVILVLSVVLIAQVQADFYFNRISPKKDKLQGLGLKCMPGRTVMKIVQDKKDDVNDNDYDDGNNQGDTRRTHMNTETNDNEPCQMCTCSVDGKNEYCSKRPARNVNECLQLYLMKQEIDNYSPFDFDRILSYRIRRVGSERALECTPYVSEYTDCTAENRCSGCTRCHCNEDAHWDCNIVKECYKKKPWFESVETFENAIDRLDFDIQDKKMITKRNEQDSHKSLILEQTADIEEKIASFLRKKRSIGIEKDKATDNLNKSVIFYHTVDEINEDTLKNQNLSGTVIAKKIMPLKLAKLSRRTASQINNNATFVNDLHIEYNNPQKYSHHITDNKIDAFHHNIEKLDALGEEKIHKIFNPSQNIGLKDKNLSKIIVNELNSGSEIIGNKNSTIISNITFTPQNDTSKSIVFIAGQLLNKLWRLEKDYDGSIEAEVLKHEKIADLLDLFKQPHTMKQEKFLKNALEKLSEAINKNNMKNSSLCENIEELKRILEDKNSKNSSNNQNLNTYQSNQQKLNLQKESPKVDINESKSVPIAAINKINEALSWVKKLEQVQNNMVILRENNKIPQTLSNSMFEEAELDSSVENDDTSSLNTFANLLSTLTKSLVPDKNHFVSKLKSQKLFGDGSEFKAKFKQLYNIDLGNVTLTSKDKLVLDYLDKIENHPNCWLETSHHQKKSIQNVEGNILLNLSEFFKVKSWLDLMKMVDDEKHDNLRTSSSTTQSSLNKITNLVSTTTLKPHNLSSIKENLKLHLRAIVDDLLELQKEKRIKTKNNDIKIIDALPCIYSILNADKSLSIRKANISSKKHKEPLERMTNTLRILKKELSNTQNIFFSRRMMAHAEINPAPASAIIWERVLTNLPDTVKNQTRRNLHVNKSQSYEDIQNSINCVEAKQFNTYKKYVLSNEVPPSEQLMLLKTLYSDLIQYMNVLEDINLNFDHLGTMSTENVKTLNDFIENASKDIKLSSNIDKRLKHKRNNYQKHSQMSKQALMAAGGYVFNNYNNNLKVTRDEVLRHLIKNRVRLYLTMREAKGVNLDSDMNYKIAKKIINYIENGNYALAKELYKIFASQKEATSEVSNFNTIKSFPSSNLMAKPRNEDLLASKQPPIQFENFGQARNNMNSVNPDHLLKLLLNMKSLNE